MHEIHGDVQFFSGKYMEMSSIFWEMHGDVQYFSGKYMESTDLNAGKYQ